MRFIQISDPHIVPPDRQPVHKFDTAERLCHVVSAINKMDPAPDFVLLTGDLTNDEAESSYTHIKSLLSTLTVPCHMVPGNHDAREPFIRIMSDTTRGNTSPITVSLDHGDCKIIMLDSLDDGSVAGRLDQDQLAWLDRELAESRERPAIVCLHHPPVKIGIDWLDAVMLADSDAFLRILDSHSHVRMVLCGHVHSIHEIPRGHYTIHTAPAVSVQFRKEPLSSPADSPFPLLKDDPPAMRLVEYDSGVFNTAILPVENGISGENSELAD